MSNFKLEQITGPLGCGEGPHWDSARKCVYLVDIPNSLVLRYVPATKELFQAKVDAPYVSFILPVKGTKDKFVVGVGRSLAIMKWDGVSKIVSQADLEILHSVEPDRPNNRFNDGKTDPNGRVFAGTMGSQINGVWEQKRGALYSIGKDRKLKTVIPGIGIANGLAWSEDTKTFYYIDSLAYSVDALDYDVTTGEASNRRVLFDLKANGVEGLPDGMTIDTNGNLWVALYGGNGVACVNPKTGKRILHLPIPGKHITSVAFGGDNLDELYVTSACQELTPEELKINPLYGGTFKITGLGVKGYDGVSAVL